MPSCRAGTRHVHLRHRLALRHASSTCAAGRARRKRNRCRKPVPGSVSPTPNPAQSDCRPALPSTTGAIGPARSCRRSSPRCAGWQTRNFHKRTGPAPIHPCTRGDTSRIPCRTGCPRQRASRVRVARTWSERSFTLSMCSRRNRRFFGSRLNHMDSILLTSRAGKSADTIHRHRSAFVMNLATRSPLSARSIARSTMRWQSCA